MSKDQFLKFLALHKVSEKTLKDQILHQITWVRYIEARYGRFIKISEKDIDKEYQTVSQMDIGSLKIVKNKNGFSLLILKDKKLGGQKYMTSTTLMNIIFPYPGNIAVLAYREPQDINVLHGKLIKDLV